MVGPSEPLLGRQPIAERRQHMAMITKSSAEPRIRQIPRLLRAGNNTFDDVRVLRVNDRPLPSRSATR